MVNDARVEAEICVVGAGPAGLAVTRVLASHRRDVLLIDSGGERPDEASQVLGVGRLAGLDYFPLHESRRRGLGGSSNHWDIPIGDGQVGARLHPLGAEDFSVRDWIPLSGWPIDPAAADPFYRQAARLCGIAPVDTSRLVAADRQAALPLDPGAVETIVFQIGAANRWRPECVLSDVPADRLRILTHVTATEIVPADSGTAVTGVRVVTADGQKFTIGAAVVVLAAGGIENARLLLLSGRDRRGLGNDRDQVGRCFMEHPWLVAGLVSAPSGGLIDRAGLYQVHRTRHGWAEARLVLPEPVRRAERLLGCGVRLRRLGRDDPLCLPAQCLPAQCLPALCLPALCLPAQAAASEPDQDEIFAVEVMAEQAPNPASRITLDPVLRDRYGQPATCLDWRVTGQDLATIATTLRLIGAEFAARQLGTLHVRLDLDSPPAGLRGGRHHMGTTRMASDRARGVVDADGRVHGLANLYVTGSSVFPTGGFANPTLTIIALALRLGAHLAASRRADGDGAANQAAARTA
ncbi:MAG TPA: GMC family oxidoreductase [Streptosporangiaceae bacterium]|nr:GMC family oxidoreductase [Streptosporangiaceae bacterium]